MPKAVADGFPVEHIGEPPVQSPTLTVADFLAVVEKVNARYDGRNYGSPILRLLVQEIKSLAKKKVQASGNTTTGTPGGRLRYALLGSSRCPFDAHHIKYYKVLDKQGQLTDQILKSPRKCRCGGSVKTAVKQ